MPESPRVAAAEAEGAAGGAAAAHNACPERCPLLATVLALEGVREEVVARFELIGAARVRAVCRVLRSLGGSRLASFARPAFTGGVASTHDAAGAYELRVHEGTPRWQALPALLSTRAGHGCLCLADGTLLCVGGYGRSALEALASVEALAPGAEEWTPRPPLSAGGSFYDGAAVACADGSVLLLGGETNGEASADVRRLDPRTGQCTPLPPLSFPRYAHCAGLLPDGRVLLACGLHDGFLATAEAYDPATGVSTRLQDLPEPRCFAASCWLPDGRFALLGGNTPREGVTGSCWAYSVERNAWEALPPLNTPQGYGCAAWCVGGCLLAAGGVDAQVNPMDSVEVLDEALTAWRPLPSARLPFPNYRMGSCVLPPR